MALLTRLACSTALLALGAWTLPALAQAPASAKDYPHGPVRIIVPFAPGGATDTLARLVADGLQGIWKQPVIIEHKPGAGTMIGADYVAKSAPDGMVLGLVNSAFPLNPYLRKDVPYDTKKDFKAVTMIGWIHSALSARADAPFSDVKGLIEYARAHPGKLNYGLSALGSLGHLTVEMLKRQEGLDIVNIPFKGGSQVMTEMAAGRVDIASDSLLVMLPNIKAGKLKLLGTLGRERAVGYNFPTLAETVPGLYADSGTGFVVPAGTPQPIVDKIQADVAKVLKTSAMTQRMRDLGIEVVASTPDVFDRYLRETGEKWGKLIAEQHISLE